LNNLAAEGKNISLSDRLDAIVADTYSDIVYGNGRKANKPTSY